MFFNTHIDMSHNTLRSGINVKKYNILFYFEMFLLSLYTQFTHDLHNHNYRLKKMPLSPLSKATTPTLTIYRKPLLKWFIYNMWFTYNMQADDAVLNCVNTDEGSDATTSWFALRLNKK